MGRIWVDYTLLIEEQRYDSREKANVKLFKKGEAYLFVRFLKGFRQPLFGRKRRKIFLGDFPSSRIRFVMDSVEFFLFMIISLKA